MGMEIGKVFHTCDEVTTMGIRFFIFFLLATGIVIAVEPYIEKKYNEYKAKKQEQLEQRENLGLLKDSRRNK